MSYEAWGEPDEMPEGWVTEDQCDGIAKEQFVEGLCAMREMLARFVEQGGDAVTANSLRLNWNPAWGKDPAVATASPESLGVPQDELRPAHAEPTATEAQHAGQWVLVPREPTEAMIGSVHWVRVRGEHTTEHVMAQAYRAMIAAAPPPAAPPSPAPPSSEREGFRAGAVDAIYWLIEWPQHPDHNAARWWSGLREPSRGWVYDANEAIWFGRKQDAEACIRDQRLVHGIPTEHVFLGAPPSLPKPLGHAYRDIDLTAFEREGSRAGDRS